MEGGLKASAFTSMCSNVPCEVYPNYRPGGDMDNNTTNDNYLLNSAIVFSAEAFFSNYNTNGNFVLDVLMPVMPSSVG